MKPDKSWMISTGNSGSTTTKGLTECRETMTWEITPRPMVWIMTKKSTPGRMAETIKDSNLNVTAGTTSRLMRMIPVIILSSFHIKSMIDKTWPIWIGSVENRAISLSGWLTSEMAPSNYPFQILFSLFTCHQFYLVQFSWWGVGGQIEIKERSEIYFHIWWNLYKNCIIHLYFIKWFQRTCLEDKKLSIFGLVTLF